MAGPRRVRGHGQPDLDQGQAHLQVRRPDVSPQYPVHRRAQPQWCVRLHGCHDAASRDLGRHRRVVCRFRARVPGQRDAFESRDVVGRNRDVLAWLLPGRLPVDQRPHDQPRTALRVHALADALSQPGCRLRSDPGQIDHRVERDRPDRPLRAGTRGRRLSAVRRSDPDQQPGRPADPVDRE